MTAPDQGIPVLVTLRNQVATARFAGRPQALVTALKRASQRAARRLPIAPPTLVRHFWLVNAIALVATPAQITRLERDPAVVSVDLDTRIVGIDSPGPVLVRDSPGPGDWGLDAIGARSVWRAYGITGQGQRIGVIDTGIDASDPDLAGKVAAWHDFVNGRATPYDDGEHGTHVAGTLVGGDAGGAAVGVAPGATLDVAKALSGDGTGAGSAIIAAAQWLMDPDGDPATNDYPRVISNSWISLVGTDTWFLPMVRAWRALGIVPVFAAGNTGAEGSIGSPASYSESIAVGAITPSGDLATFSSVGPVTWTSVNAEGLPPGTSVIKPDLVAPGAYVMSTVSGGYAMMSGTSTAAPHVAGAIALLEQAAPAMTVDQITATLAATADDLGPPGPDNRFGAGKVDVYAAIRSVLGAPPTTSIVKAPPAITRKSSVTMRVASGKAKTIRTRIDNGRWSRRRATRTVTIAVPPGRHRVHVESIAANGYIDPVGTTSIVTSDRTGPKVRIQRISRGDRVLLVASVANGAWQVDPRTIRWEGGHLGPTVLCDTVCPATVSVIDGTNTRTTRQIHQPDAGAPHQ